MENELAQHPNGQGDPRSPVISCGRVKVHIGDLQEIASKHVFNSHKDDFCILVPAEHVGADEDHCATESGFDWRRYR